MNSHIRAVRSQKGEEGVRELERRFGRPLQFGNMENVPVADEVRIIEHALDLLSDRPVPPERRAFAAGELHFTNFLTTPFAKIILGTFRTNFKLMMLNAAKIAGHVFRGVRFSTEELGPTSVRLVMANNDYPIDHFRGLFSAWMKYSGYTGTVTATETAPNEYSYVIAWSETSAIHTNQGA